MTKQEELGQVIPLTALFMVALLLMAALAIDVTGVLSAERFYTTTADAAALAGAQDLQEGKTRKVTPADRMRAREHALEVVLDELDAVPVVPCATNRDIVACSVVNGAAEYQVSVITPAPYCERCARSRAVKVTIRNPGYPLTFASLVGQGEWNVESSAVAGIDYSGKYALISLKPDDHFDQGITGNGNNVTVNVHSGDIGTNSHLIEDPADFVFPVDPEFGEPEGWIYHNNETAKNGSLGFSPETLSKPIPDSLIQDPMYLYPDGPVWPTDYEEGQNDSDAVSDPCPAAVEQIAEVKQIVVADANVTLKCYNPGNYQDPPNKPFKVPNGELAYLLPGVYMFQGGITVDNGGYLLGGLDRTEPGVLLSVPADQEMDLEGAHLILNTSVSGPAVDGSDPPQPMISNPYDEDPRTDHLMITIWVARLEECYESVGSSNPAENKGCDAEKNASIKLAGTGQLEIAGVIYAPTRRVAIRGGSESGVLDGQIIGWTLEWSGGSTLDITYPDFEQLGVLRQDGACTGMVRCS